jgi:hypothetical protein
MRFLFAGNRSMKYCNEKDLPSRYEPSGYVLNNEKEIFGNDLLA